MRPHAPILALAVALAACGEPDPIAVADPVLIAVDGHTPPRTVVLISLDTLRPERLGAYGGTPDVAPVIDAFAQEAVVFDQALAPSPWTLPSHMTMLTGLDPLAHGTSVSTRELNPDVVTLADTLSDAGYETGAFTDGGYVLGSYGFDQGFDVFDDQRNKEHSGLPNGFPRLMPKALDWLDDRDDDSRVFLFLHSFDAHTPYDEVEPGLLQRFRERPVAEDPRDPSLHWASHLYKQRHVGVTAYAQLGELLNDYDAGVHEADLYLGQLFEQLRSAGRWDDALVIVTSDHGESFFDHGLHVGHGMLLADSELRVPLLVKLPGGEAAGTRQDALVGLVDLYRTVGELTGATIPDEVQGESLVGLARGLPRGLDHVLTYNFNIRAMGLVTEAFSFVTSTGIDPMVIGRNHLSPETPPSFQAPRDPTVYTVKLSETEELQFSYDTAGDPLGLRDVLPARQQLYDRAADPHEQHNLADKRPGEAGDLFNRMMELKQRSEQIHSGHPAGNYKPDVSMDRALAALGYIHATDGDEEASLTGVPPKQRLWTFQKIEVPEQARLSDADRRVHRVRVRQRRGERLEAEDNLALQSAGELYMAWLADHPEHTARIDWRLFELDRLARSAGFQLEDIGTWLQTLQELR